MKLQSEENNNFMADNEDDQTIAHQQELNARQDFDSCLSRLPKGFINYYKKYGFNGDIMQNFKIIKRLSNNMWHIDILTQYNSGIRRYQIYYRHIAGFKASLQLQEGTDEYNYINSKISSVDNNYLSHEIKFTEGSLFIRFNKLSFKRLKNY